MRLTKQRGYWYVSWTDGRKTRRTSLGIPQTAPRETAEQALADFAAARERPPETVDEILTAWLKERRDSATSHARLVTAWKMARPHFGALRPDQVSRDRCRAYITRRQKDGVQAGTIRKELSTLRTALTWWDKNTPAQIQMPPAPPPKDRYLTRDEVAALIEAADAPHIRLAILLMWSTGARKGAILDLTWGRVDFGLGLITLANLADGKRRKGRATVPMTDRARAALLEAQKAATCGHVIEFAGKRVVDIRTGFAAAVERAGLVDVTPHVLRHSAAVALAEAGVPMAEIAAVLGHSDSRITESVYARFSPGYLRGAISALD